MQIVYVHLNPGNSSIISPKVMSLYVLEIYVAYNDILLKDNKIHNSQFFSINLISL